MNVQMSSEARAWLDATVKRILARYPLGDPERVGLTYELMSHLHAAGEKRAAAAGRGEVGVEDLSEALRESGGEEGLAVDRVQPMAKPEQRVLFWRRLGAFAVDVFLLGIAIAFVHGMLALLEPFFGESRYVLPYDESEWAGLLPWGFHDSTMPVALQALIATVSGAVVLGYFTWFEGHEGRSLGKRVFELRVVRADGRPMTYRESLLRNLVKLSPLILVLDAVAMLLFFRRDKQRVSDKIAETIVVRA